MIPDEPVEFFAFDDQEVGIGRQNSTFGGDGTGRVNIVARHHSYYDTSVLT